jgi:hypothetical protein
MRVYVTTTVENAKRVLCEGFRDVYEEFGRDGVWLGDIQRGSGAGFDGDVTLCMEVPENQFEQYEASEPSRGCREALIPADVLNRLCKPLIYDHSYAGCTRRELVKTAESLEQEGDADDPNVNAIRAAIEFFDEIGWLTPVKLQEQASEG